MSEESNASKYKHNAQSYFGKVKKRDSELRREQEKSRATTQQKVDRLRALRLARESGE